MEDFKGPSDVSHNSSEEDFSWANKKDNGELKKLCIEYPFKKWKETLNIDFSNNKNIYDNLYTYNVFTKF